MNQRIPEIAADSTKCWRNIQGEDIRWEAASHSAGEKWIRIERIQSRSVQLDSLIEGNGLSTVRIPTLVLLTAVKDSVADTSHGPVRDLVGDTNPRREV